MAETPPPSSPPGGSLFVRTPEPEFRGSGGDEDQNCMLDPGQQMIIESQQARIDQLEAQLLAGAAAGGARQTPTPTPTLTLDAVVVQDPRLRSHVADVHRLASRARPGITHADCLAALHRGASWRLSSALRVLGLEPADYEPSHSEEKNGAAKPTTEPVRSSTSTSSSGITAPSSPAEPEPGAATAQQHQLRRERDAAHAQLRAARRDLEAARGQLREARGEVDRLGVALTLKRKAAELDGEGPSSEEEESDGNDGTRGNAAQKSKRQTSKRNPSQVAKRNTTNRASATSTSASSPAKKQKQKKQKKRKLHIDQLRAINSGLRADNERLRSDAAGRRDRALHDSLKADWERAAAARKAG